MMDNKRIIAFLLGVGISFNSTGFTFADRSISVGFVTASLYFLSLVSSIGGISKLSTYYGKFIYLPLIYFFILIFNSIVFPYDGVTFLSTYFLDWILMIFVFLHSLSDDKCTNYIMDGIMVGASVVALCFTLGIGVSYNFVLDGERFSIFGSNCNVTGMIQSLASIITIKHILYSQNKLIRLLLIIPLLLQLYLILSTASRTAFLIVAISLVFYVFFYKNDRKILKVLAVALGCGLIVIAAFYLINNDALVLIRLFDSRDNGTLSGRTDIWETLLPEIPKHLFLGVGETGYNIIANKHFGHYWSPHNELIYVLLTSGVVGLAVMLVFWTKSVIRGICAYRDSKMIFYFLICLPTVFAIFSQQMLYEKFAWLSFAIMVISAKKFEIKQNQ